MEPNIMKNYTKTKTDRAWFSRLVRHPARKQSGSVLTTLEPAMGYYTLTQLTERGAHINILHSEKQQIVICKRTSCECKQTNSAILQTIYNN